MSKVTVIVTDNNRPDLLMRTLESFEKMNTYPVGEVLVHNDGTDRFMKSVMERFPQFKWYFSGKTIGYAASLDFLLNKVTTDYVFNIESDWNFFNSGFIEKSMKILDSKNDVHQVWIRDAADHHHPLGDITEIAGVIVRPVTHGYRRYWNGWSWNPALRRMADIRQFFPNGLVEYRDEIDQARHVQQFNYRAVSLVESCIHHIGYGRRSINFRA
jgi:hypothetical protein